MDIIAGFAPISDARSRILILGSMPSQTSLQKRQYYGHTRNMFWPLMCTLLDEAYQEDYEQRTNMLLRHGIALWDVAAVCEREGSSDAAIKNAKVNDFATFFAKHKLVKYVFFNGSKAYELYRRRVNLTPDGIEFAQLGSTSPAHAVSFDSRLDDWKRIVSHLERIQKNE